MTQFIIMYSTCICVWSFRSQSFVYENINKQGGTGQINLWYQENCVMLISNDVWYDIPFYAVAF